jgi:hypothetical protein
MADGAYVRVTGVCSLETDGPTRSPVVRLRWLEDITVLVEASE